MSRVACRVTSTRPTTITTPDPEAPATAGPDSLRAYAFLTVTTLCWGANTVFAKLAVGEVSPMMLILWRWLGVVALAWVLAHRGIVRQWPVLRRHLGYLAAMGALYRIASSYREAAEFLDNAPTPQGMTDAEVQQYRAALKEREQKREVQRAMRERDYR